MPQPPRFLDVEALRKDGWLPRGDGPALARDRLIDVVRGSNLEPNVRPAASDDEYQQLLRAKLSSSAEEFLASGDDADKLAEVVEVLHALATRAGIGPDGLEKLRADKAEKRGAFNDRIVWSGNLPA